MMISKGPLSQVDTTAQYRIGSIYVESPESIAQSSPASYRDFGPRTWVYVYNGSASTIAAGALCQRKTGTTVLTVEASATTAVAAYYIGVAQHAIITLNYGWILKEGAGLYVADTGGTTIDHVLIPGNAVAGAWDSQANSQVQDTIARVSYGIVISAALATVTGIGYFRGFR